MLKILRIENYALIESLTLQFYGGLNILTGETGTGKSILMGALGLILGDRSKTDMIRQGTDKAVVEAEILIPDTIQADFLMDILDHPVAGKEVILRRELHRSGRNRAFIDDIPVPLNLLAELGDQLIDLHGQHDHQALLRTENHLTYLDNYSGNYELLNLTRSQYRAYFTCLRELREIKKNYETFNKQQELLRFQLQEINRSNPDQEEDVKLEREERLLNQAEKLVETGQILEQLLYEGDSSVVSRLSSARSQLLQHLDVSDHFAQWIKECDSARITVQELYRGVIAFLNQIDFDAGHLEQIRQRLGELNMLKKKYGPSLYDVLNFQQSAKDQLEKISTLDETIREKETQLTQLRRQFSETCNRLSEIRRTQSKALCGVIIDVLKDLGLNHGEMDIQLFRKEDPEGPVELDGKRYQATEKGLEQIEFLISLNPGESPRPLRQIASGGEISRIMLAIKTVLAETDDIPVLVFDEIDTGISGRIARVVGKNLKAVSHKHQVICITHLPQIASMGDVHYSVDKEIQSGRTRTIVRQLNADDRVVEIAKLLGGEKITDSTLATAKELLQ
jgi:DNA repair protein RecN (Recombination protein N)